MSIATAPERATARARTRPRTTKRSRFVGLLVLLMLLGVMAAVLLPLWAGWRVIADGNVDDRRATDAIVVLGAAQYNGKPSPVFRSRLDHARVLYRQSVAPRIVTVGGKQPGDRFTEASAGLRYLNGKGVSAADITSVGRSPRIEGLESTATVATSDRVISGLGSRSAFTKAFTVENRCAGFFARPLSTALYT